IGAGARLRDCYVGPYTAVGERCTIAGAEVEHSILLAGCTVSELDGRLESSMLGRNVTVRRGDRQPRAYRFMVGDNSDISILSHPAPARDHEMRLMVSGAGGMLGHDVMRAGRRAGHDLAGLGHGELDVAEREAVERAVARERPEAIVNCAA